MSDELAAAKATELGLREQISDLVHARTRAEGEAKRLSERATLPGAHEELAEIAGRYQRQSKTLATEIETLRTSLRSAEAELERLRAPNA
ncbi:MAG: hypothetical protein H0W96_09845 [Solirubrobacterales bacterium]|nr:hypothetical protein [Solirubrobacterales bacterium]